MFATEKNKRIDASSVQNFTTSGTAGISLAIAVGHIQDVFVRIATTAAAYFRVSARRSGGFTLNPDGAGSTATIDANASAAQVQAALVLKAGAGTMTVTGTGTVADPFIITFISTLGLAARTLTKVSTGIVDATVALTEVTLGDGTHNEVFSLSFAPTAATTADALLPAGTIDVVRVQPGDYISVIQVTAAGIFSLAVVEP